MLNEATWMLERWLTDSVYGVNAVLQSIPKRAQDKAPRPVTVVSDLSNESIAMERDPDKVPALLILADEASDIDISQQKKSAFDSPNVTMAFVYVDRETPILQSRIEGGTVLRAVRNRIIAFNEFRDPSGTTDPYREINGIRFVDVKKVSEHRLTGAVGRSNLYGFVLAEIRLLDTIPR